MKRKTYLSLYIEATQSGGFTVNSRCQPYDASRGGYAYGVNGFETRIAEHALTFRLFQDVLARYRDIVARLEGRLDTAIWYVGCWHDEADNSVYFDVSIVTHHSLAEVIAEARANKQKAIWDFANNCEVRLDTL